jgi:hypothetical protein
MAINSQGIGQASLAHLSEVFNPPDSSGPPAAWYIARNLAGMRLAELGQAGGGIAYPAVNVAIKRFEKRLQIGRDLRRKLTYCPAPEQEPGVAEGIALRKV